MLVSSVEEDEDQTGGVVSGLRSGVLTGEREDVAGIRAGPALCYHRPPTHLGRSGSHCGKVQELPHNNSRTVSTRYNGWTSGQHGQLVLLNIDQARFV